MAESRSATPRTAFLHVTLIDGSGTPPIPDAAVVIEGGRIVSAGPMNPQANFEAGTKRIDLSGKFMMPGIIDSHVHYEQPSDLLQFLAWGVTSVNCMFESPAQAKEIFDATAKDSALAPQVYPTTPIFSVEQGWWSGDGFPVDSSINRFPKTPADARAQVGKLSFDHIKLMYDDMIWCRDPLPRMARMEEAVMRALIEEGRKRKFFSEVHAPQYADAREMLEAGVDAFAHGILDRAVDPEFVAQMQRQQTMYLPTFCVFEFLADTRGFMKNAFGDPRIAPTLPPGVAVRYNSEEYFQHYKETYPNIGFVKAHLSTLFDNMKTLHEAGIVIPMGTDMWAFPGIGAHLELEYMVEAGMTPSEAIVSCTSAGAKFLKQENIGMIEAGKQADLLILNSDPTKDIRNTRDIDKIVRRGVIYDHAELVAKVKE